MDIIRGKYTSSLTTAELATMLVGYREVWLDIGTGDGRYVQYMTRTDATRFVIGIDACRENLRFVSQHTASNALFAIANAEALPPELTNMANRISINFPWGSLLDGLLCGHTGLLDGLIKSAQPGASLDIRLNSGALVKAGLSLEVGGAQVCHVLKANNFYVEPMSTFDSRALRSYPTTWAHRLAVGRDPRAVLLRAHTLGATQVDAPRKETHLTYVK